MVNIVKVSTSKVSAIIAAAMPMELEPDMSRTGRLCRSASRLLSHGKVAEALVQFDDAIAHQPDATVAWLGRGKSLLHQGKLGAALGSLERALDLAEGEDACILLIQAQAFAALGNRHHALALCEHILAIAPQKMRSQRWQAQWSKLLLLLQLRRYGKLYASIGSWFSSTPADASASESYTAVSPVTVSLKS